MTIEPAEEPLPPTPGAPGEPAPVVVDVDNVGVRNLPLAVLAVIAVVLLLQFASPVFIPVVVAMLTCPSRICTTLMSTPSGHLRRASLASI